MRAPLLYLLVISALLVTGSDAWGWRRVWRRVVRVAKTVVTVNAVAAAVGKRAAACGQPLTEEKAAQLAEELAEMCPKLDYEPGVGLTRDLVEDAFESGDVDSNGALAGTELENFSNVIQAYQECESLAQATGE